MRPATSGRSVTDSSERRLPTAVIVCGIGSVDDFGRFDDHRARRPPRPPPLAAAAARRRRRPDAFARCVPNQNPAAGGDQCDAAVARCRLIADLFISWRFSSSSHRRSFATAISDYALRWPSPANRSVAYASAEVRPATLGRVTRFRPLSMLQPRCFSHADRIAFPSLRRLRAAVMAALARRCSPRSPCRAARAASSRRRPAKLVVPFPPGGPLDIVGRAIAQKLTETWGQTRGRREQARRRRQHRRRLRRQVAARRLHDRDGRAVDARGQSRASTPRCRTTR